jgi:hypothetical protein
MAVTTGVLAPFVGRIVDRAHPRPIVGFGFSMLAIALTWLSVEMTPTTAIWRLILPLICLGVATAFIFAPLAATATRNLPPDVAGAASGVYNATRQVGSVMGSAAIAAFMTSRISAEMPGGGQGPPPGEGAVTELPSFLLEPFAAALSQSLLLPAFIGLFGVIAAIFLLGSVRRPVAAAPVRRRVPMEARTEVIPAVAGARGSGSARRAGGGGEDSEDSAYPDFGDAYGGDAYMGDSYDADGHGADDHADDYSDDYADDYDDDFSDDEYVPVEYVREPVTEQFDRISAQSGVSDDPLPVRSTTGPVDEPASYDRVRRVVDDEPLDLAHNGFHRGFSVDDAGLEVPGRHYRFDGDDIPTYGRHSHPRGD